MGVDIQTYRAKIGSYRHNFGTDVATCVIVINFSRCLKYIGSVLFIGILLMMAGIEPNPGPKDLADDTFDERQDNTTIKVTGLPDNVADETLVMFFENERRQGGGEVNAVSICERDGHALVTFKNKTAVETVLNKKPIIFLGREIQVESYVPAKIALSNLEVSKLFVAWLPSNVTEETLTMFFENERRQGGGVVLNVTIDTENQTAVVEFENPEAVSTVLQKRPIIISGQEVKVDIFDPQKQQSPALEPSKLFVAGLPSNVTEETLTMFFENERKQGGGVVLNVTIDTENQTAVVEFENPKAVQTVLQKRPIIISRKEVQVDIFEFGAQTVEDTGQHNRKITHRYFCKQDGDNDQSIVLVTRDDEGLSCQNRQINDETKAKNSGIRRTSEGDTVQLGGVNELHTECVQISTHGQTIEPMAPNNEVPGLSLLAYEKISNAMEVQNQETRNVGEESAERSRNENDTQNKCEEDQEDHQLLESVTMDHKGNDKVHNQMKSKNLEIEKQSKEGTKQRRDEDNREKIQSDTAENKGHGQVHNQMKLENLDIEKQSKEDKKQHRDEYDRETKCEGNDKNQTLQSDTLKDKVPGLSLLAYEKISNAMEVQNQETRNVGEESAERSRNENDTQNKCEEDHEDHQLLESVTMDHKGNDKVHNQMKSKNLEIEKQSKEGTKQRRDEDNREKIQSDTAENKGHGQVHNQMKLENLDIEKQSKEDKKQHRDEYDRETKCEGNDENQTLQSDTLKDKVPGLSLLAYEKISNAMEVQNQETRNVGEESAERSRNENDTQNKCEEDHEDHQLLESVTMDHKDHERSNNAMEIQTLKRRNVSEESAEQSRNENDIQTECEEDQDKHQLLESVTQHHEGNDKVHNQMKSKNLEIEKQSKEGTKQRRDEDNREKLQSDTAENKGHGQVHNQMKLENLDIEKQSKEDKKQRRDEYDRETKCEGNDEHQTLQSDTLKDKEREDFRVILQKLSLVDKFPCKLTMNDVIAINPDDDAEYDKQAIPLTDAPLVMLKRLMYTNCDWRDIVCDSENDEEKKENDFDLSVCFIGGEQDEADVISPLDIFSVVFQCCDSFLKQKLIQKLYLCKMAVPFLFKTMNCFNEVISIWPFRSLTIESKRKSSEGNVENNETDILHFSSKVVAFARFGRPLYSKSKLLNCLLTSQECKTFFNKDCPLGMTPRRISYGQVEMFWLPLVGDKRDKFNDAMTFMNMRGDINEHFSFKTNSFIANFADTIAIVSDTSSIQDKSNQLKRVILQFPSVILIVANSLTKQDVKKIHNFEKDITNSGKVPNFQILSTHKGTTERNLVDMVKTLTKYIDIHVQNKKLKSIDQRLTRSNNSIITTDEDGPDCQCGRENAENLLKTMTSEGNPKMWKQKLTPVHGKYSKELGELRKKYEREKDFKEMENLYSEMENIRMKQTREITASVKHFIQIICTNSGKLTKLQFFLSWLHIFIEKQKREIVPELIRKSHDAREELKIMKNNKEANTENIEQKESEISRLESEIEDASFSVEHFFREIGFLYEAILVLKLNTSDFDLPLVSTIAKAVGTIVANGHQLKLIDGESFYLPYEWLKEVMKHVEEIIKPCKVMVLSVLGLQSSGKSTLLNTMFGSQFATRTGRCTRGIHIQLVPISITNIEVKMSPFDYVLIVDTEGLRSTEVAHIQYEHDNELATVITGLGDITMLNIMGENTSEIRDILQVIVHAFLRIKMTNRDLVMRKWCTFIHQNVTDISASEKMKTGLGKLMQTLDEMTEESAKSEGILDITTFNQVIEFDVKSHVWYLKNLWQGNPPMARVNTEYSENVVNVKCNIVKKPLNMKGKSYKSPCDILQEGFCLWKGILNEDFVFSFRNSLEARVYMDMDKFVHENLWQLERIIHDKLVAKTQSRFADCTFRDGLREVSDTLIRELKEQLIDETYRVKTNIASYFETNKHKEMIIRWQTAQQGRTDILYHKLEMVIFDQVEKTCTKRSVEILTVSSQEKHEEELRLKSIEVAKANKDKQLSQCKIEELFEEIWNSFFKKVNTDFHCNDSNRIKMQDIFIERLYDLFKKHSAILKKMLEESSRLSPLPGLHKLQGSFGKTGINLNEDVSRSIKGVFTGLNFENVKRDVLFYVENILFKSIDEKIDSLCQVCDEITALEVTSLINDIEENIVGMKTNSYSFKPTFKVSVFIHICRHARGIFEKHNENYTKTKGIAIRLQQYKQQQKISFEAHLQNRKSEDIVARLFSNVIEVYFKEHTLANISNKIMDALYGHLPNIKNRVVIQVCKSLAKKGEFNDFVRYLKDPKTYAYHWLRTEANTHLFCKESGIYFRTADSLLTDALLSVRKCLLKLKNEHGCNSAIAVRILVDKFYSIAKKEQLAIRIECFRSLRKENVMAEDMVYLTDAILANMRQANDRLVKEFKSVTEETVLWENNNPIESLIQKIWGCPEKCPFCGEPCAKTQDHIEDLHYCIQHRPSCCVGIKDIDTQKASVTACNFDVNSNLTHRCGVFNFVCDSKNKGTQKQCSESPHKYRNYKQFYPNWDIAPSSAMHESSQFWMCVCGNIQDAAL